MSNEFLSDTNLCGQTILRIVSRGNAIVAELLRMSNNIPPVFIQDATVGQKTRYSEVLFDFKYLKQQDFLENKITSSSQLMDLDDEFKDIHMPILDRFYLLFNSIYKYIKDFLKFLSDLENGVIFIQQTFESILVNQDGKQLLAEALHMYGVMLILLDLKIPGLVRERMLISYYRYKGAGEIPNIDAVCKLCRSTGFDPINNPKKYPQDYPIDYFARTPIPDEVVSMIIGRLRSDDIYQQTSYYPLPEHRSVALSTQSGMLYIILYFKPSILISEQAIMREIVDKHFPDNWICSYYMGFTVDLSQVWMPFKAANMAINNTIEPQFIVSLTDKHVQNMRKYYTEVRNYLTEGVLVEEYVLDRINKLLSCLRNCNVTIRWLILHRTSSFDLNPAYNNKKYRKDHVSASTDPEEVLILLLNTAQFEFVLKNMFQDMLAQKEGKWQACKNTAKDRMKELSEYFSGERALQKIRDEQLQSWFMEMSGKIDEIDYHDATLAGRNIQQLITALEDVEEFHQIESSLQVKQFLGDTRDLLKKMIRYVNIKEEVLVNIATISDVSYAWEIINDYVGSMQKRIKKEPSLIIKMRSTFLKLASMLELPLVRISQAKSSDIVSVSQYFSGELVNFVRRTLEIIPISMFTILDRIIEIQTHRLSQLPTRLPRDQLKEFAQLDDRYELAMATYEVSKYTEGILAMEKTLMGIIEVDPKRLLEDGIRKELVRQISVSLEKNLVWRPNARVSDFEDQLKALASQLHGMLRSFEYIQDYVNVYGLKIWQEEFGRIIHYNVEQECNRYMKRKIEEWQSPYQSQVIPIPRFRPLDDQANNFMGRLLNEVKNVRWSASTTFTLFHKSISIFGLSGFDTLLSCHVVQSLQALINTVKQIIYSDPNTKNSMVNFRNFITPASTLPTNLIKIYIAVISKMNRLWPIMLDLIMNVGRGQLIRRHVASELNFSCKLNANQLYCSLDVINNSLLADVREHFRSPSDRPYPNKENPLLAEVSEYLDTAGMTNPISKVYITCEPLEDIGLIMCLFVIAHMSRFTYDASIDCLVKRTKNDNIDGTPFVVGIITALKQFHPSERESFLAHLGQYVRSNIDGLNLDKKGTEIPMEVKFVLRFLQNFCRFSGLSTRVVEVYIPSYLFARVDLK
ncbi:WASH complex subunit strumpellin [Acrasis kona]|uniref:WASH complex subunit strumpellin n=1 Tax=Acrasis kona TaxID=1008807 RepID=A0AAW2ZFY2_9EUKA